MKLTVVTATFNVIRAGRQEKLSRCVKSVAALGSGHEHLIVDGASDDGTLELLKALMDCTPGLRIVSGKDAGIYDAYNKGARLAKGEWVYYLGCDDYILNPSAMKDALECAERKSVDFVVSPVSLGDSCLEGVRLHTRLLGMGYSHQGVIMKRSTILDFGGFDLRYRISGDVDLTFRLHLAAVPFCVYNQVYAYFDDGGLSSVQLAATREESTRSIAGHLGLSEQALIRLRSKRLLPFFTAFKFLFHRDPAIRLSAARLCTCSFLNAVGLIGPTGRLVWQK